MKKISLEEILEAREKRAEKQNFLLQKYHQTLLSFTMNIAGEIKNSPLIRRSFLEGLKSLKEAIKDYKIIFSEEINQDTGSEFLAIIDIEAEKLKEISQNIEESHFLGRLFDIDIIDKNANKLSRKIERKCIICGKIGRGCASRRVHSIEEIVFKQNQIMQEGFLKIDAKKISDLISQALIKEVEITPKAGLVDKNNNGSHKDMNLSTFYKSANSLMGFWEEFFLIGVKTSQEEYDKTFLSLRKMGQKAEEAMFLATKGINTHKGAIFLFATICGAMGRLWRAENPCLDVKKIAAEVKNLSQKIMEEDFLRIKQRGQGFSFGEDLFLKQGVKGARGEIMEGLPSVLNCSLPRFKEALSLGKSENEAGVIALLHLIALGKDSTLIKRGGFEFALEVSKKIQEILKENPMPSLDVALDLDNFFIKHNLSAGGCADLLAVSIFFNSDCFKAGSYE